MVRRALDEGHSVVGIDRVAPQGVGGEGFRAVRADVGDYAELLQAVRGSEALIHLAAYPSPNHHPWHEVHNNNVVGSYNALSVAVELGISRVCQASSVNAIGGVYSRTPRYDYFPVDERHPTYNEDPYSLSKWVCELQGDSIVRRHPDMTIGSLRFHMVVDMDELASRVDGREARHATHLWGYTESGAAADACLRVLKAGWQGHEAFYIVAPVTTATAPSAELARTYYPDIEVRGDLAGHRGFFDCSKAGRLLGWVHPGGD